MTDVELLKSKIKDCGYTIAFIANKLGMSPQSLSNKLVNGSDFKAWQMIEISKILKLSRKEEEAIFFTQNVDR